MNEENILAARTIIGEKVKNHENVDLGNIKELLVDAKNGKIEYGVISYGGLLGLGDKNIAVPYEAFIPHQDENYFVLNVDKDTLDNANSQIEFDNKSYYIY